MKIKSILEELLLAKANGYAVGAFNIFNYLSASAVIKAAEKLESPLILQTTPQTVRKFGPLELGAMLRQLAWNASINVIVHLDHCTDVEMAKACIDAGWNSVMYDGSRLPLAENIKQSKEVVQYAHARGLCVEGELGRISGVEDDLVVDEAQANEISLENAQHYVKESGIDIFAPAIGTAHGVYKGNPIINFEMVKALKDVMETPIVIHGGTGLSAEIFRRLIKCGGTKINVSTAVKYAYIGGCKEYIEKNPDKLDPIGLDKYLGGKIEDMATEHIKLFRGE